jgi:hypothetical protein
VCPEGFTGNAFFTCQEIGCKSDSECLSHESCVNRECVDPCNRVQCARSAYCRTENHQPRCHCLEGYYGNPFVECQRPECRSNSECSQNLACVNEKCVDPCSCANNAQCITRNHIPICQCPPGYTGSKDT